MTSAEWEMIVPDDDHQFADEFRRRGVRPGARLRVVVSERAMGDDHELPDYFGSFTAAPDLAERSASTLRAGLSRCPRVRHHGE